MSIAMKAMITIGMVLGVFAIVIFLSGLVVGFGWAVLGWVGLVVLVLLLAGVLPVMTSGLASRPDPSKSYNESMLRFQAAAAHPEAPVLSICEPQLLVHGRKTDKVFVLIHGLSNCPYSFSEWAPDLHAAGHNVLAPRMPYNGHKDNTTDALRHTTARELADFCDHCIDVAAGLGHEVIVIGISGGGILAGWIAQNRPEVTRAVLVAPAFGLAEFGVTLNEQTKENEPDELEYPRREIPVGVVVARAQSGRGIHDEVEIRRRPEQFVDVARAGVAGVGR